MEPLQNLRKGPVLRRTQRSEGWHGRPHPPASGKWGSWRPSSAQTSRRLTSFQVGRFIHVPGGRCTPAPRGAGEEAARKIPPRVRGGWSQMLLQTGPASTHSPASSEGTSHVPPLSVRTTTSGRHHMVSGTKPRVCWLRAGTTAGIGTSHMD